MYEKLLLNYGRNALRYIIKIYGIKKLYLPYYLCSVIRHSVVKENCKPIYYHIDDNFFPIMEFPQGAYILYPNYFGVCDKNVEILVRKYSNLIVDNAHSFYSKPTAFACFNSIRKFQKTLYGSELWLRERINITEGNRNNINIEYQQKVKVSDYRTIEEYENSISNIQPMFIKNDLVIENNRLTRLKKFKYYNDKLSQTNQLKIDDLNNIFSPFCYPYLAITEKDADKLVKLLTNEGKIVYRYWQNIPQNFNEYKFYRRLVAISLD